METGFHLYCLLPASRVDPAEVRGIDGREVIELHVEDLGVWCSPCEKSPAPDLDRIRAHDRVIRGASTETVTALPFRFGQWFAERSTMESRILGQAPHYREALDEVAGAVEFGIRLEESTEGSAMKPSEGQTSESEAAAVTGAGAGAEYLRRLAREREEREIRYSHGESTLEELHRLVAGFTRKIRVDPVAGRGSIASAAHLVPHPRIEPYRDALAAFMKDRVALELRLTGPWPPYSFADAGTSA